MAIESRLVASIEAEDLRFRLEPIGSIELSDSEEWLIDGLLPPDGLAVLYGEPGIGKSFLALDIGFAIATGLPWAGKGTHNGEVIYIAAEGARGLRRRAVACRESRPGGGTAPFSILAAAPDFGHQPGDAIQLIQDVRKQVRGKLRLVIVDTLARTMQGADENSTADMSTFIANCALISAELGCAVLVIHHAGENAAQGLRGSSALNAAADGSSCFGRCARGARIHHEERMAEGCL